MSELHRITFDPHVCSGPPTIRGLRIRVKDVLELLASGATQEEILEDHPSLKAPDIVAALEYAARQSDHIALSDAQATIPQPDCTTLKLRKGDEPVYTLEPDGRVLISRAFPSVDDPFATFDEWGSDEDRKAYADL